MSNPTLEKCMTEHLYQELTGQIVAAFYRVFYDLRSRAGCREAQLVEALVVELRQRGLAADKEVGVTRRYRATAIGAGFADLVVEELVAVEVKKVKRVTAQHRAQLKSYLVDGGWAVGLLLNFGGAEPEVQRIYERANDPTLAGGGA